MPTLTSLFRLLTALALGLGLSLSAVSLTQAASDYPNRTVTLIVPFPAGSGTDSVARVFSEELSKRLDTTVIVENKPGANATIAANYVARAKPDGYTLFVTTNTSHSAAPWLMRSISYDPIEDFTPIARGGNLPFMLLTRPDAPFQSVQELVDYAKASPGKVTYGSGNSTGIVAGGTLQNQADIDILHIPYKGTPQALTDLVSGQIDFMFTDLTSGTPFTASDRLRALAVTTAERSALLADIPSMQEAGVDNFDITSWNGFFGPAGLDRQIVTRLNQTINDIVNDEDVRNRLASFGFDAFSSTPEEFAQFTQEQYELWGQLIKDAGLTPQ